VLTVRRLVLDPARCIGCAACATACARALGGTGAVRFAGTGPGAGLPSVCRHCADAPCLRACPSGAIRRDGRGAVVLDPLPCVGCRSCVLACPYGAMADELRCGVAVKCDLCAGRAVDGLEPACTATCPSLARRLEAPRAG